MAKSSYTHNMNTIFFILKRYKIETICFIISLLIICILELTTYRIKVNIDIDFIKLNNLIVVLLSSYVASYIFWFTNFLLKHKKDIANIHPHLSSITRNMILVYDEYIRKLKMLQNDLNNEADFAFNRKTIDGIIEYAAKDNVVLKGLCNSNHITTLQIFYDIDLLLKFTPFLDTVFLSKLMEISRNTFIIQHKDKVREDLSMLYYTADMFIMFSKSMEDLREYAKHEFYSPINSSK